MWSWDRQRVLALVWLVGAGMTGLTLAVPYDIELDQAARTAVAVGALVAGVALWRGPRLPAAGLHGVVVAGSATIAYCTSLGVPDVEGVMFLLPIVYASATFPARAALGHVLLAIALFGVVLLTAEPTMTVAPWVSFVCVAGVGAVLSFVLVTIVEVRERERLESERDRRIAGELQRTLLPGRLPAVDGAALAARYLPAAREADVGGDLYDAFLLPDGRLALFVGDVAGKGLAAAQAVSGLRHAVRAYGMEGRSPGDVLVLVDHFTAALEIPDVMATMLLVVLDPTTGHVAWVSAGHPPPLCLPAGGAPHFLDGRPGPPLGVDQRRQAAHHHGVLGEGDALLLFTDGLVERRGEALDLGMRRLAGAAGAAGPVPLPVLLDAVLPTAPRPLEDDVTTLAVRRVTRTAPAPASEAEAATAIGPAATAPLRPSAA